MTRLGVLLQAVLLIAVAGVLTACGSRTDLGDDGFGGGGGGPSTACKTNADCTNPAKPKCDIPAGQPGQCVACLTSPDTCPTGETCDPTSHECKPNPGECMSDSDCKDPALPHCRTDDHTCVECTNNSQCPSNDVCNNFKCVGFCGGGSSCAPGLACCNPLCVDETNDVENCGSCGNACGPFPHATPDCAGSACGIQSCDPGFADCDGNPQDGCETSTGSDPLNCGKCGNACPPGDSCSGGVCVGGCGPGSMCPAGEQCCGASCENTVSDPNNCGSCGNICGAAAHASVTCAASKCAIASCAIGFGDCNHVESDGCEANLESDNANCGGCGNPCAVGETCTGGICAGGCGNNVPCQNGLTCCFGMTCENTTSDLNNCGGCGNACPSVKNGAPACSGSMCAIGSCNSGFADCNKVVGDGCEISTDTDPGNCGACGKGCAFGAACVMGVCQPIGCNGGPQCNPAQQCCMSGCASTQSDPNNCGGCGKVCPPNATCMGGTCIPGGCNGGPTCVGAQQCCMSGCSDTTSDLNNCGGCGMICPVGDTCVNSMCKPPATCNGGPVCMGMQTCCATGCSDTTSDPKNCGGCGMPCAPGDTCVGSICVPPVTCNGGPACSASQTCCPSGCADLTQDSNNCGKCNVQCGPTASCVESSCVVNEGAFDPLVNPTYLSPGIHNYTTINIPAGVTVYVAGPGASSGTLDLHATGAIVIDGTIDLSGGPGTQNTIASMNTQLGKAGSGGYTGEPYQSAPLSSACAFVAGNPGLLGFAGLGSSGTCTVLSTNVCVNQNDPKALIWTSPVANFGGGAGVFTGFRAYGSGGGGIAGGAPGGLGAAYPGEQDCTGVSGGGGATKGAGGKATGAPYDGKAGLQGQTQCAGLMPGVPHAYVGGGGGGSIGAAAAGDLAVLTTFQTGSSGGGGSCDYLNRPVFGGTSGGGGGGGALKLSTPATITIGGQLLVNGGPGGDAQIGIGMNAGCDPQPGAAGGGGSGGIIYISAPSVTVAGGAVISAVGGLGGEGSEFATGGGGGDGGLGRIRLSVTQATCSLGGSFKPPLSAGCTPKPAQAGFAFVGAYPN